MKVEGEVFLIKEQKRNFLQVKIVGAKNLSIKDSTKSLGREHLGTYFARTRRTGNFFSD
jgi:hypothetical protein